MTAQLKFSQHMEELGVEDTHTTKISSGETAINELDQDVVDLARKVGKKQVLKRQFGFTSMTGFGCGLMCTWETLLIALTVGFGNGGPAGLIYGFLFVWAGTISTFIAMGELASMYPTAGGQYHWVSILAPRTYRKFISYVTGWITVSGWVAAVAGGSFFVATLIQALITTDHTAYSPTGWQATLLLWAVVLISLLLNTVFNRVLPVLEIFILLFHVLVFFAIIIPLVYLSPHNSSKYVFTTFNNAGGFSTVALASFVGMTGNALAFVGTDGVIHMSEEVKNATKNVGAAMVASVLINGFLAFGMLLAVLYSAGDYSQYETSRYPFIPILIDGIGTVNGALTLASAVLILQFCPAMGSMAAASRMVWSFSRDKGLPGSTFLSRVDPRTTTPVNAVISVSACAVLLSLINIGSSTAFGDVISLILETFYTSYLLAVGSLLYRRLKGDIGFSSDITDEPPSTPYVWGPWHLPGALGVANNAFACAFLIIIAFFSYWPSTLPVSPQNMNYSSLVTGSVMLFSVVYYWVYARKVYNGPIKEL